MILRFGLRVALDDGTVLDITTNARDQFAFEEHFDGSIIDLMPEQLLRQIGLTAANGKAPSNLTAADARVQTRRFGWLAWHALHRTAQVVEDFDGFSDRLDGIEVKEFGQARPTPPAPPSAS